MSTVVFLDGTVVNLALPATERDIGGGMCSQQWIVDGYLLAVAAADAISEEEESLMVWLQEAWEIQ